MAARAAVEVLPHRYLRLFDRARARFESDERFRALWLAGSLARGTADAASDLDLILTVADDHHQELARSWRDWLGDITPTVLAEELPFAPGSFYCVTPDYERLDIVLEPVSVTATTHFPRRVPVFDHDDLARRLPEAGPGPPASSKWSPG